MKRNTSIPYKNFMLQQARESKIIKATQEAFMIMALYTLYMDLDLTDEQIDNFIEKITKNTLDLDEVGTVKNFTSEMSFVLEDDLGIKYQNGTIFRCKPSKERRNG